MSIYFAAFAINNINRAYKLFREFQCEIRHENCPRQDLLNVISALTSNNMERFKKAEMELSILEKHQEFLELLVSVLPMNLQYYAKKTIVICLQKYVNKIKQTVTSQQRRKYIQLLATVFSDNLVDFKLKLLIVEAGTTLLQREKHSTLFKQAYKNIELVLEDVETVDLRTLKLDFIILSGTMLLGCIKKVNKLDLLYLSQKYLELSLRILDFLANNLGICSNLQIEHILARVQQLLILINFVINTAHKELIQDEKDPFRAKKRWNLLYQVLYKGFYLWQTKKHNKMNRFFWFQTENENITQALKSFKVEYLRLLITFVQRFSLRSLQMIQLVKNIAKDTILGLQQFFLSRYHYHFSGLDQIIEKNLKLLIAIAAKDEVKQVLHEQHVPLIRAINKIFDFSIQELNTFSNEPILFVNNVFSIIEVQELQKEQQQQLTINSQVQGQTTIQLANIKILTAKLFKILINLDQSMALNICREIFTVIYHKIAMSQRNIAELLMILCLIKDCKFKKEEISDVICSIALELAVRHPPLVESSKRQESIQYALALIAISIYLTRVAQKSPQTLQKILELSVELISSKIFFEAHRVIAEEIIESMYQLHSGNMMLIENMLKQLNRRIIVLTNNASLTYNIFDSLFFSVEQLTKREQLLSAFVSKTSNLKLVEEILYTLSHCIEIQLQRTLCDKQIINKCWNIIRMFGENEYFAIKLMKTLESVINHLVDYLSIFKTIDFEEDCFLLMVSFIKHSQKISKFIIALFRLIPSHFYGQYAGKFAHSFQALQWFIFYGRSTLIQARQQILNIILQMSVQSLLSSEPYCFQGMLLLQSLLLSIQQHIGFNSWKVLFEHVKKKIALKSISSLEQMNLLGLLGLCYKIAKVEWVQHYEINQYLRKCSSTINRCKDEYCMKVVAYSFCEILLRRQKKYFAPIFSQIRQFFDKITHFQEKSKKATRLEKTQKQQQFQILKHNTINSITMINLDNHVRHFHQNLVLKCDNTQEFTRRLRKELANLLEKEAMRKGDIEFVCKESHNNHQNSVRSNDRIY